MLRADFNARGPIHAVMHSFCGDKAMAAACLDMGLFISLSGMITYKTADAIREMAKTVPLERLMVETDCPYLSPVPMRGKRNEPAFVAHTARCLAETLGVPLAIVEKHTNCKRPKSFSKGDPTMTFADLIELLEYNSTRTLGTLDAIAKEAVRGKILGWRPAPRLSAYRLAAHAHRRDGRQARSRHAVRRPTASAGIGSPLRRRQHTG